MIKWLEDNHNIKVSQTTISTTLKRSAEILAKFDNETNLNAKRKRTIRYPEMESALVKWFRANQKRANDALPSHGVKPTRGFYKVKLQKVETWRHAPGFQL